MSLTALLLLTAMTATTKLPVADALVPFLDGGKEMPVLYKGWFDEQIGKQAATAVSAALAAGKRKIEVNFPPVPNLEEVKFGTPLNQKFGKQIVAKDLNIPGGYRPGSDLSRNLVAFGNMFWAKRVARAAKGGPLGKPVTVLSAEPVTMSQIKNKGDMTTISPLQSTTRNKLPSGGGGAVICVNPGGEEIWDRLRNVYCQDSESPFVVLNSAYSTTYDLGNKAGYEEAYYLKRISKGWVFRTFPGPWMAYLERPDGTVECLQKYRSKPSLKEVSALVREESFKRYAINNDRWTPGFGERL